MEIISYVLQGNLGHKDSMGNIEGIPPGDVQRMSAGSGVHHSEFNHAPDQTTHFLQIWIEPNQQGVAPGYEQKTFADAVKQGRLCLVASNNGAQNSVSLHADARIHAGLFHGAETATLEIDPTRKAYVHLVRGALTVNGERLHTGDALALSDESRLELGAGDHAEVLVFDLTA
jgi:hypothetical protein